MTMCLLRFASMVRVEGVTMPRKCATTLPCFSRAGGPSLGAWRHPMLMVDTDSVVVEARLLTGELGCPSCGGVLRPRGSVFADAWEALGRAGAAGVRRLGPRPPWEFASWATGGLLLAPPARTRDGCGRGVGPGGQ